MHPSMKSIVVKEITSLLFRPSTSLSAAQPSATSKHIRFQETESAPKFALTLQKANANVHASYYSTVTLNQVVLSHSAVDKEVARQLLDVYFDLFKDVLHDLPGKEHTIEGASHDKTEKVNSDRGKNRRSNKTNGQGAADSSTFAEIEDSNSRHISAILTGVNRALPFAELSATDVA
jgi:ribosome biogenesis protein MAK21